jgi:hypothetical protein
MRELAGYVDGLPNLCGSEQRIWAAIAAGWGVLCSCDDPGSTLPASTARSRSPAHAPAAHPVGGPDLRTAAIIGNLQWMLEYSSPSSEP